MRTFKKSANRFSSKLNIKALSLLFIIVLSSVFAFAQKKPVWHLRTSFSPATEDKFGFGVAFRQDSSRWFHQLELYPLQNRGSSITIDPINFGGLLRTGYIINDVNKKLNITAGAELYSYRYSRQILGNPGVDHIDFVTQMMVFGGLEYQPLKRVNINFVLPIIGFEHVNSKNDVGNSSSFTPAFLGLFAFFQPKFGIDIGLF